VIFSFPGGEVWVISNIFELVRGFLASMPLFSAQVDI
jgi:hypothetical protein